jgi:type IV secretory pathway VirJ component
MTAICSVLLGVALLSAPTDARPRFDTVEIRGHHLTLHLYGAPDGAPLLLSSGDGGWVHLAPSVAEMLASRGFLVIGLDSKAYLESFTEGEKTLSQEDVRADFRALLDYVAKSSKSAPILIGVSEGAGLSVLAATAEESRKRVAGVVALGLPDVNELAWRFRDSIIYLTKKVPDEPTFSVESLVDRVAPVPLATIHSTHDEFVPLNRVQEMMERAREPKKLWIIDAPDHRFSGREDELRLRVLEAIEWIETVRPSSP